MAGFLARRSGDTDSRNVLGLSSRYTMPREVRQERDREVGISIARTQVIEADIMGLKHAGAVGIDAIASINDLAEVAAARLPEERARVDSVADTVTAGVNAKLSELAGGIGR